MEDTQERPACVLFCSLDLLRDATKGSFGPKMPATSVATGGASRVFTATWPPYTPASTRGEDHQQADRDDRESGPYCQVAIRTLRARTSGAAFISSSEATTGHGEGGDLLFVQPGLLLRSYNSVSLSDDGAYSLTLSDCHGFIPIATSSPDRPASSPPWRSRNHDGGAAGRPEWQMAEIGRLLFLPLPSSIDFEVNRRQATSSGAIIGNFHLLPVAHVPQLQHAPVFNTETSTTSPGIRTVGHADYTPGVPVLQESSRAYFSSAMAAADTLCDREKMACTGEGPGVGEGTAPSSIGGGFTGGVAVGVVLSLLLVLVVFRGGWGKDFLENFWTLLKGDGDAGMKKSGWGGFIVSIGGEKKEDGVPHCVDAPGKIDDGSSDSDETLIENVPEPVGLPRSEEDWRVLFDTLYED
ncbi:unnamed protein product [Ectocarpus sp. CCAP 1310/34]|nr:unnamed protein product [Ectocarpus sp. CCAP 1310/34]